MDLINKYRPALLKDVVGHAAVVASLGQVIGVGSAHAFLFSGPSGIGKTTLARIVARMVRCDIHNITEIDAATHSSVDAMRQLTDMLRYHVLGESPTRMIIIDEAHALSKQAWQSLLKSVEEPQPGVFWAFCSTEPNKVPLTIRNRCVVYALRPLLRDELMELGCRVLVAERLDMTNEILQLLVFQAGGSPRRLLTYIAACVGMTDKAAVLVVTDGIDEDAGGVAVELARALVKGRPWREMMKIVKTIPEPGESTRRVIVAYLTKVVLGAGTDAQAGRALEMLDAFADIYDSSAKSAPLLLSIGRCVLK